MQVLPHSLVSQSYTHHIIPLVSPLICVGWLGVLVGQLKPVRSGLVPIYLPPAVGKLARFRISQVLVYCTKLAGSTERHKCGVSLHVLLPCISADLRIELT